MTPKKANLIVRSLVTSLLAIFFVGCNRSSAAIDETSTDTSTSNINDSSGDTSTADTDSDSIVHSDNDSNSDFESDSGSDSKSESTLDSESASESASETGTDTDTASDNTDTDSNVSEEIFAEFTFSDGWDDFFSKGLQLEPAVWTHNPDDGSLDVVFDYNGAYGWTLIQKSIVIYSEETNWIGVGADWSDASEIVYTFRVDEAPTGGIQPFILSGSDTEWCGQWFDLVEDDSLQTVSLNIGSLNGTEGPHGDIIDISNVREIGFEINIGPRLEDGDSDTLLLTVEPGTIRLSIYSIVVK